MIKVNKEKCPQDHECALKNLCPEHAISQKDTKAPDLDNALCNPECNLCVENCLNNVFERIE